MINKKNVIIIDYQLGNLFSVKQACDKVGMNSKLSSNKDDILKADGLILPGVGAFNEAMNNLHSLNLIDAIKYKLKNGTPLFGICLGLQLLFTQSEEFGSAMGLDIIKGVIKKFPLTNAEGKKIKVPHISWNRVSEFNNPWNETPLKEIQHLDFMYFIHSYYVKPSNESCILTNTNYDGIVFCSSILQKNIFATQFHPEKSAEKGISIYENWAKINNLI